MRKLFKVSIVTANKYETYTVGDVINGLKIVNLEIYASEGCTEVVAKDAEKKLVLNIVNCPIVAEYAEFED